MITYDDFAKLDIRIGTIVSADEVEGADKLLKLMIDVGEDTPRQILAGIKEYIDREYLVGKQIPVLVNLEPRTLRGLESQGMILAASNETDDKKILALLHPHKELPSGSSVK